jgi:hypothetical protein
MFIKMFIDVVAKRFQDIKSLFYEGTCLYAEKLIEPGYFSIPTNLSKKKACIQHIVQGT